MFIIYTLPRSQIKTAADLPSFGCLVHSVMCGKTSYEHLGKEEDARGYQTAKVNGTLAVQLLDMQTATRVGPEESLFCDCLIGQCCSADPSLRPAMSAAIKEAEERSVSELMRMFMGEASRA
jgi:hypothetical protein